jgi:hypothetical protein
MRHYAPERWVDFARDTIQPNQRAAMQAHLDTGCARCAKLADQWQWLHAFAGQEPSCSPSESAIRTVEQAFSGRPAKSTAVKDAIARLLFDSSRAPLAHGVRSTETDAQSRHLLYGSGSYRVDVRIEPQMDSDRLAVIGQILNSNDPDESLEGLSVLLLKGQKIVAQTHTNPAGEFHADFTLDGGFRVHVALPNGRELGLPLIDPTSNCIETSPYLTETHGLTGYATAQKRSTGKKV